MSPGGHPLLCLVTDRGASRGDLATAAGLYRRAHELAPHLPEPLVHLGFTLNQAGATRWEFINFGVSGYYLSQYVAVVRHKVLEWDPDLVLIGFYAGNDARIPPEDKFSITYHAPQPRAVLRVVDPNETSSIVGYDEWGRVELTTLTREFFMPRFLERDEALRRRPCERYPWDGVGEVRPFGASETKIVEGVY